jgi:hypothetical protein
MLSPGDRGVTHTVPALKDMKKISSYFSVQNAICSKSKKSYIIAATGTPNIMFLYFKLCGGQ